MNQDVNIQVRFSVETKYGTYVDALYYNIDDWPVQQEIINQHIQKRIDNWIYIIEHPPIYNSEEE